MSIVYTVVCASFSQTQTKHPSLVERISDSRLDFIRGSLFILSLSHRESADFDVFYSRICGLIMRGHQLIHVR